MARGRAALQGRVSRLHEAFRPGGRTFRGSKPRSSNRSFPLTYNSVRLKMASLFWEETCVLVLLF